MAGMLRHAAHFGEEFFGEDGEIGFLEARGGEDVDDLLGRHGPRDDLTDGVIEVLAWAGPTFGALGKD